MLCTKKSAKRAKNRPVISSHSTPPAWVKGPKRAWPKAFAPRLAVATRLLIGTERTEVEAGMGGQFPVVEAAGDDAAARSTRSRSMFEATRTPMPSVRPTFFGSIVKVYQSVDSDCSASPSQVR